MAARGVRYVISSTYDSKGQKKAQQGLTALGKSFLKTTIGIGSATAAIAKMNQLLQESVQSALADERAVANLNKVLSNSGFGAASSQVLKYIDSMQMATGVSEDVLRPAFLQLFNSLHSVTKAQDTLRVAMDVSAATGKDLGSVTAALSKAAAGSTTAISRLGLGIKKTDLAAMSFDQIITTLEGKFAGSAATAADTMSGKMDRLKIATSEAKEEIGKGLVDAFNILASNGGASIDSLQTKIVNLGTATGDLARGLASIASQLQTSTGGGFGDWLKKTLVGAIPGLGSTLKVLGFVQKVGAAERQKQERIANAYGKTSYFAHQAQINLAKQANSSTKLLSTTKKVTAETKKQADMKKKSAKYDLELIGLAAALGRAQSAENRARLQELFDIAQAQYGTKITAPAGATLGGPGTVLSPNAGSFRLAEQGANMGVGYSGQPLTPLTPSGLPSGGVVNNNININALSTMDIQQAVAAAVNSGSRAGLAYTQVFSRL